MNFFKALFILSILGLSTSSFAQSKKINITVERRTFDLVEKDGGYVDRQHNINLDKAKINALLRWKMTDNIIQGAKKIAGIGTFMGLSLAELRLNRFPIIHRQNHIAMFAMFLLKWSVLSRTLNTQSNPVVPDTLHLALRKNAPAIATTTLSMNQFQWAFKDSTAAKTIMLPNGTTRIVWNSDLGY